MNVEQVLSLFFLLSKNCDADQVKLYHDTPRTGFELIFPTQSSMGIGVALTIPVTTLKEIVFVGFIFEASYNMVIETSKLSNEEVKSFMLKPENDGAIFTRTSFYRVVENRLNV